jgi:hypothetical protein
MLFSSVIRQFTMSTWDDLAIAYAIIAIITTAFTLLPLIVGVRLRLGGADFAAPAHFSKEVQQRWDRYCSDLPEMARSWQRKEKVCYYFHRYCAVCSLVTSWLIVPIGTLDKTGEARWMIVVLSGHAALALGLHKISNVGKLLPALQTHLDEIRDLTREYQHNPVKDGHGTSQELKSRLDEVQLQKYIEGVEDIRKKARATERANLPLVEQGNGRNR